MIKHDLNMIKHDLNMNYASFISEKMVLEGGQKMDKTWIKGELNMIKHDLFPIKVN